MMNVYARLGPEGADFGLRLQQGGHCWGNEYDMDAVALNRNSLAEK